MKGARYAVQLAKTGQNMAVVSSTLSISNQSLYNSTKANREGKLFSEGSKPVTEEHMESAR